MNYKVAKIIPKYIEQKIAFPQLIEAKPDDRLNMVVVLPAFKEENILPSLSALINQEYLSGHIEIIVLVNHSDDATDSIKDINATCLKDCEQFALDNANQNITIHPLMVEIKGNKHGVGFARKIGLDEGVRRLNQVHNIEDGLLVFYDADAVVESNYLQSIRDHFLLYPKTQAASIYFEHVFAEEPPKIVDAITAYELHLRYHTNAMRFVGLPYAFQTVGSSIAVSAIGYIEQGGMNRKQAGEDFYFLNKFAAVRKLSEVNTTCNYLASRLSDRVPFGTGRAMHEIIDGEHAYTTYDFGSYKLIKQFIDLLPSFYQNELSEKSLTLVHPKIVTFLLQRSFISAIKKMKGQVKNIGQFEHRFYQWFHPLMNLQLLHYLRDELYPNLLVAEAATDFLLAQGIDQTDNLLFTFRNRDKMSEWWKNVHL